MASLVAEPLIPYISLPEIPLGFLMRIPGLGSLFDPSSPPSIKPFGALVALGVYAGAVLARKRAQQRGIDDKKISDFIFWVVAAGFIGGHVLDAVFYHPDKLRQNPLYVLRLWDGLSSYGGFTGALIGAWLWRWARREKILPIGDVICSAFPLGWMFGRAGCAAVHDHPGALSDSWIAVRFPSFFPPGYVGRFDLGLYECILTIPLVIAFAVLWRRDPFRPAGFYAGWMCVAYAPVRFVLDFFREEAKHNPAVGDPRYGGLTPAQWACFGLLALGVALLWMARNGPRTEPPPKLEGAESRADAPAEGSEGAPLESGEGARIKGSEEASGEPEGAKNAG